PPEMMRKLSFSGNSIIWSSVNRLGYTTYMVDNRPQPNNEWFSKIYTQLKAGKPVIVGAYQVNSSGKLAQHWVLVKGYSGNSKSSFNAADFQINDPMNPFSNLQQFFVKYNKGLRGIVY
ncbi:MAG: C39 family peptidase, partial [Selenomonadaceae bacterium]|nr:C39 family peptidase [Selenomonadaceae bacterium]